MVALDAVPPCSGKAHVGDGLAIGDGVGAGLGEGEAAGDGEVAWVGVADGVPPVGPGEPQAANKSDRATSAVILMS